MSLPIYVVLFSDVCFVIILSVNIYISFSDYVLDTSSFCWSDYSNYRNDKQCFHSKDTGNIFTYSMYKNVFLSRTKLLVIRQNILMIGTVTLIHSSLLHSSMTEVQFYL